MGFLSLSMIISSSLLILLVTALRPLLRGRVSARLQYALWLLVALRLLLPIEIGHWQLSVSSLTDAPAIQEQVEAVQVPVGPYQPAEQTPAATVARPQTGVSGRVSQSQQNGLQQARLPLGDLLPLVWLAGALVLALWQLLVNLSFARRLRRNSQVLDIEAALPLRLAPWLSSPCLFGFLRPVIYFNRPLAEPQRSHILTHELCHRRQGDNWWALVRALCLCLHWFNPLVWLAAALSRRDGELACDQAALTILGPEQRIAYGETLLALAQSQSRPNGQVLAADLVGADSAIPQKGGYEDEG